MDLDIVRDRVIAEYRRLTPGSRAHMEKSLSATVAHNKTFGVAPYATFIDHSSGACIYDADGRALLDFEVGNMGSILGHGHPGVKAAVIERVNKGVHYTLTPTLEADVAQKIVDRLDSVDAVRFNPSGSDATNYALRVSRAFTGRPKIAKMTVGFHGNHDAVYRGLPLHHPQGMDRQMTGLLEGVGDLVVMLPFNDVEGSLQIIRQNAKDLAALIVEPILGSLGCIPASQEYLEALREITAELGIILIFDEMICLGVARGGAQSLYGIAPDLTTAGKTIAGGFPLAFYGGRRDLIELTARPAYQGAPFVMNSGTYQSQPVALASASAVLDYSDDALFARINYLGDHMRAQLGAMIRRRAAPMQVTGRGHMFGWWLSPHPVTDGPSALAADALMSDILQTAMLNKGVFTRGQRGIMCAQHTDADVGTYVSTLEACLEECGVIS